MDCQDCIADNVVAAIHQRHFHQLASLFHQPSSQAVFNGFVVYHMAIVD